MVTKQFWPRRARVLVFHYLPALASSVKVDVSVNSTSVGSHLLPIVRQYIIQIVSGGSSVSQNKLPQLILGYIYILKYLQSNFIG